MTSVARLFDVSELREQKSIGPTSLVMPPEGCVRQLVAEEIEADELHGVALMRDIVVDVGVGVATDRHGAEAHSSGQDRGDDGSLHACLRW